MANLKENKKYHFTYKTTNLINGRYYLGMHSTNRIDDGYIGSGKRLYYEISKYGRENFKLEVLEYFISREELVQAEITLITEEDLRNTDCLNCKPGGSGGFSREWIDKGRELANRARMKLIKEDPEFRENYYKALKLGRQKAKERGVKFHSIQDCYSWKGKKHKPETIEKMKLVRKGTGTGTRNSQFGTCWITDGKENKKMKKSDTIPEGWYLGRKLKN